MTGTQELNRPSAWLLDLTRLISRVGRGPMTGIDRVEYAYLRQLLKETVPIFGLVRTNLGYILLDRNGIREIETRISSKKDWGSPDLLARLNPKTKNMRGKIESDLRRFCIRRTPKKGLGRMLAKTLPEGSIWLNVGHSNLNLRVFDAVRRVKNARAHVMVHDMIPLLFPQFQKQGTVASFERRMRIVSKKADLVIYNSNQSKHDAERFFDAWGRTPKGLVAYLGVDCPSPNPTTLPKDLTLTDPYFVTTGTIEPRKNHALLLDVWKELAKNATPPTLVIIGQRGWENTETFNRLDANPSGIIELNNLNDGAMASLIQGAKAALFPSLAEGYGLPPCEAVLLGTQVIANDLKVTREILGNIPIYANALDMYSWVKIIRDQFAEAEGEQRKQEHAEVLSLLPTWQDHFNLVLNKLG